MILKINVNEYLMFGIVIGWLALMGFLIISFMKRCANMDENFGS